MDKMLDAGFWILGFDGNQSYFIPAKDGIFDQNQASSIKYRLVKWYKYLIFYIYPILLQLDRVRFGF